jgi:hypothetical protein
MSFIFRIETPISSNPARSPHGRLIARIAACSLSLAVVSCTLLAGRQRVRDGLLYVPGNAAYDAYFRSVHAIQIAAPHWDEARKTARKSLCDELKASCDAPDSTLAQLTHERMVEIAQVTGPLSLELASDDARMVTVNGARGIPQSARSLFRSVELTARSELDRGRQMRMTTSKVDELVRTGRDYEERAPKDFSNSNVGKASEVRSELTASIDLLTPYSVATRAHAQGAEDFVLDLKRAIASASSLALPGAPSPAAFGTKGHGTPSKPSSATEEAPQKPAPKKPAPAEEVFNP